jgi:exopolyphosphatase/guanosine-5'-triphosphate,3'-diphosphate pyrophosphatase
VKIAALDLGSNSFHLIVAESADDHTFTIVERAKEMVLLGEHTLLTRVIPAAAAERGLEALGRLRRIADRHDLKDLVILGTAALREAANRDEFCRAARAAIGRDVRIADEHEEARLTYLGAAWSLGLSADQKVLLFDLGGGSLEVIVGDAQRMRRGVSLKLGGLRLAEQWLRTDPPSEAEVEAVRSLVRATLEPHLAELRDTGFDLVAFSSGTANALRRMSAPLGGVETPTVSYQDLVAWEDRLIKATAGERLQIAGLHPQRIHSVVAGTMVLRIALQLSGHDHARYCDGALREGMILDYLAHRTRAQPRASDAESPLPLSP